MLSASVFSDPERSLHCPKEESGTEDGGELDQLPYCRDLPGLANILMPDNRL